MLAEPLPVVARDHHERVLRQAPRLEVLDQASELRVREADLAVVGRGQGLVAASGAGKR